MTTKITRDQTKILKDIEDYVSFMQRQKKDIKEIVLTAYRYSQFKAIFPACRYQGISVVKR